MESMCDLQIQDKESSGPIKVWNWKFKLNRSESNRWHSSFWSKGTRLPCRKLHSTPNIGKRKHGQKDVMPTLCQRRKVVDLGKRPLQHQRKEMRRYGLSQRDKQFWKATKEKQSFKGIGIIVSQFCRFEWSDTVDFLPYSHKVQFPNHWSNSGKVQSKATTPKCR